MDYEVSEIFSGSSRIYFTPGDGTSNTISGKLNFTNPGEDGGDCDSFTAYVTVSEKGEREREREREKERDRERKGKREH